MPWGLKRYQQTRQLHFITFSCYHRAPFLDTLNAKNTFIHSLERTRRWYGFYVAGYVVMPEHVHLLISEPERSTLHVALQMLKQIVSRKLRRKLAEHPFWQPRYYDFNVWSEPSEGWLRIRRNGSGAVSGTMLRERKASWRLSRGGRRSAEKRWGYTRRFAE